MRRLMDRLNVDPAFAAALDGGLAWHEARAKCIFCAHARAAIGLRPGPPLQCSTFCSNAEFFLLIGDPALSRRGTATSCSRTGQ